MDPASDTGQLELAYPYEPLPIQVVCEDTSRVCRELISSGYIQSLGLEECLALKQITTKLVASAETTDAQLQRACEALQEFERRARRKMRRRPR
jgi:hypothetical protein